MKSIKYKIAVGDAAQNIEPILQSMEILCSNSDFNSVLEYIKAKAYNGEYTIDDVPDPPITAEEARAQRDKLLAETDWTQVLDAPISAESREAFRVYRQALRDITEQEGFPEAIEWPVMPQVIKAEPDPVDTAVDVLLGGDEA